MIPFDDFDTVTCDAWGGRAGMEGNKRELREDPREMPVNGSVFMETNWFITLEDGSGRWLVHFETL
eukprot:3081952-Rhodomonas_salina.1